MVEVVKGALEKFWELDVSVILQAINDFREIRDEVVIKNTDFFSNQIKVEKHKPIMIRFSNDFADDFLSTVLQSRTPEKFQDKTQKRLSKFKLTDLTQLEIRILNNFSEFLFKRIKEILIPVSTLKLSETSEKYFHFIFMLGLSSERCSKIMISIPQDRINKENLEKKNSFTDEDFLASRTKVRIKAGNTKITLEELKNLAIDDIVILENSSSSRLTLISGDLEKRFKVKVNSSLVLNLDDEYNNDETYNEVIMEKNLWDDIQIELSAEFEKVKMTIGELKQITSGQVVDLGSVFNTEISLFVEDKKVAKGDLIIINDRYAVKLNEVLSSDVQKKSASAPSAAKETVAQTSQAPNQASSTPAPKPQAPPTPPPAPQKETTHQIAQDEEFDYSDFEK